jgi:hypothetical protein
MAFTDAQFVAMNLPAGASFSRNGITMTAADAITAALDEANDSRAGALVILFLMLEADHLQSESLGAYSYSRYQMRGSDYWRIQQMADVSGAESAPNVVMRPLVRP